MTVYSIDKIEKQINLVNKSALSYYELLENMLMWVRANSDKITYEPQKHNFTHIYFDVVEVLKLNAKSKEIEINYDTETEINIHADINMLKTILRNLISNAIKFTNKG